MLKAVSGAVAGFGTMAPPGFKSGISSLQDNADLPECEGGPTVQGAASVGIVMATAKDHGMCPLPSR